jgi:phosphoesterase RecJ-like protein
MHATARQIHQHIQKANSLALVSHQNPDGDTLGSALAFAQYLLDQGKEVKIFCLSLVPDKFNFLHNIDIVSNDPKVFTDVDTITVLDCGDLRYAGVAELLKDHDATIINIDHHATNEKYGEFNLVMDKWASTTEVVYNFFKINNVRITPAMATALLTGLITDTDNFTNGATSYTALTAASELLRLGANWIVINRSLLQNKSIHLLKLWGLVLSRLKKKEEANLAYTYLTNKDMVAHGADDADVEGIANFLNKLNNDDAAISLFMKETEDGKIKGSFRTTKDGVDVAAMAKKLGGGGHKKAAGFTVEGTVETTIKKVLDLQSQK